MARTVDFAYSADGRLCVLRDDGSLLFQDPNIGTDWQHVPASARPQFVWRKVAAPPVPAVKVRIDGRGLLAVLGNDGQLYQQTRTRGMIEAYVWQLVEVSDG